MAITFVGASVQSPSGYSNVSANVVLPKPAGVAAGDYIIASVVADTPDTWWSTVPAGFALVRSDGALHTYLKVATASEPSSYTFTNDAAAEFSGVLAVYRGATGVQNTTGWPGPSEGSFAVAPGAVGAPGMIVRALGIYGPTGLHEWDTIPSGTTKRAASDDYAGTALVCDEPWTNTSSAPAKSGNAIGVPDGSPAGGHTIVLSENRPPNSPILLSPADSGTVNRDSTQRFDWDFSDPDTGDSQSAYNFRYRETGAATWAETGWVASTSTYHDVAGGTFTDGVTYEWQVATKDAQGDAGPFSSSWFFTATVPPTAPTITYPTNGGTFLQSETVEWSAPNQDAYQIRITDGASTVEYDSGTVESSTARSATVEFPTNGVSRTIQVRVRDDGLWSQYAEVTGTVSWLAPPAPTFTLAEDAASGSLGISISNPAPSGSEPAASYNDVFVDDGAGEFRMATNVAPNGSVTYWLPKSGRDYSGNVRVRAIAENGVYADS